MRVSTLTKRLPLYRTLEFRLSVVIGIVILLAVTLLAAYATASSFKREVALKRELLMGASSVYAAVLSDSVAAADRREAALALRGVDRLPGVTQADIRLTNGRMLTQFGSGAILVGREDNPENMSALQLWSARQIRVETPIMKAGAEIGTLGILADISDTRQAVLSELYTMTSMAFLAIMLGIGVARWMIAHLTRPLGQLTTLMESFAADRAKVLPKVEAGNDETGVLANTFNTMISSILERDAKIEHQVETLEDTVSQRTQDLRLAKDAAEEANAAKSDFLATMSHEIRTPMNGMLVMAEMLSAADLSPRHRRYAEIISSSGESLLHIINDILDLSKIESGKLELELRPVSVDVLVNDVVSLFWERAREKKIGLAACVSPRVPNGLLVDPTRLNQVVTNLVNNALKFTEAGGVTLHVDAEPGLAADEVYLVIKVIDTGIGIPEDKIDGIFESFSQADQSTTRRFGGTGLGLTVCRRLADAMNGDISVSSKVDQGSVFKLSLPAQVTERAKQNIKSTGVSFDLRVSQNEVRNTLARSLVALGCVQCKAEPDIIIATSDEMRGDLASHAQYVVLSDIGDTHADELLENGKAADVLPNPFSRADIVDLLARAKAGELRGVGALKSQSASEEYASFVGLHVLAADDNAVNREVLRETLGSLNVKVDFAEDGLQAVEMSNDRVYDAIFMDGSMPVLDGFEATRRIRARENETTKSRVPIIALTAEVVGKGAQAWKDAGADHHVTKPFSVRRIADLLSGIYSDTQPVDQTTDRDSGPAVDVDLLDEETISGLKALGARSGNDLQGKVWGMFARKAPTALADILSAAEGADDLDDLARLAHALKSMALSAGAKRFAASCSEIERHAKANEEKAAVSASIETAQTNLQVTLNAMGTKAA